MLQAFRRGLLTPEHTFGIASFIRERIILDTLNMEDNSDYVWRNLVAKNIILAPHYAPNKIRDPLNSATSDLQYIAAGYSYNSTEQCAPELRLHRTTASLQKLFNRMKKSGILDTFQKQIEALKKKTHKYG